jgi:hypothetical protein
MGVKKKSAVSRRIGFREISREARPKFGRSRNLFHLASSAQMIFLSYGHCSCETEEIFPKALRPIALR